MMIKRKSWIIGENTWNIIFIPSICPETFSYTTGEAIQSNLPVFCFDIGGQSEQVKNYNDGHIIPEISVESAYNSLTNFIKNIKY